MAATRLPAFPATEEADFEALAAKVEQAIAGVQGLDADAKAKGRALKSAIDEFHDVRRTDSSQLLGRKGNLQSRGRFWRGLDRAELEPD